MQNIAILSNNYLFQAAAKVLFLTLYVYSTKFVFVEYGFPNLTLTSMQLLFTFIAVLTLHKFGLVQRKKFLYQDIVISTALLGTFFVFANLSIDYNAVEVSQFIKLVQLPIGLVLMMIFLQKSFSIKLKLTTLLFILAITLNSVFDYTFDTLGLVFALLAGLFGSLFHLWLNKKQAEEDFSPLQMLMFQAPAASLAIFLFSPAVENNFELNGLFDSTRPLEEWCLIFLACVLAAVYNLVAFYTIETGNSPMTHLINNSINYISLIIIVVLGDLKFDEPLEWQQILCLIVVPIGILLYSKFRGEEEQNEKNVLI